MPDSSAHRRQQNRPHSPGKAADILNSSHRLHPIPQLMNGRQRQQNRHHGPGKAADIINFESSHCLQPIHTPEWTPQQRRRQSCTDIRVKVDSPNAIVVASQWFQGRLFETGTLLVWRPPIIKTNRTTMDIRRCFF